LANHLKHFTNQSHWAARFQKHNTGSATDLPWGDDFFDAVITDPPYYDNVPYADLSDFFYVWLKRTVGHLHPDLFATPLTPKSQEMVADACGRWRAKARNALRSDAFAIVSGDSARAEARRHRGDCVRAQDH
jgi:adenine-specific DNA methylase